MRSISIWIEELIGVLNLKKNEKRNQKTSSNATFSELNNLIEHKFEALNTSINEKNAQDDRIQNLIDQLSCLKTQK
jgi:hypothetical protein